MSRNNPVDPRVRLAISPWPPDAPRGAVTTFCAEHGISRKTFYPLRARAATDGPAAVLEPTSRRPRTSPARVSEDVKRHALETRASLEQSGLPLWADQCAGEGDHDGIACPLERDAVARVP